MAKKVEKKPELLKLAYTENGVIINHCLINDRYPTEEFIAALNKEEKASLVALFKIWAQAKGHLRNGTEFKKLEDYHVAILEFKDYQLRLAGFWRPGYNFNLVYGFKKKQDNWPKSDLNTMRGNYDAFIAEEKSRTVTT